MTVELSRAVMSLCSELPSDPEDHGHVVVESDDLRVVLAALSTPPADDDVREALVEAIRSHALAEHLLGYIEPGEVADVILSTPEVEVRPRGTVTDAESIISALSDFSRFGPLGYREQKIAEAAIALARA